MEINYNSASNPAGSKEELRQQYNQESALGRTVLAIVKERDDQKLTPWTDISRYPHEAIQAVAPREEIDITETDIQEARRGSFGLALETAAQIHETQPPRHSVKEDITSLELLLKVVRKGHDRFGEMLSSGQNEIIAKEVQSALVRRGESSDSEYAEEKLRPWAEEQFDLAEKRLYRSLRALEEYQR